MKSAVYHNWTDFEVRNLTEGIREYGTQFRFVQQNYLPYLSVQVIKNKYYKMSKKDSQQFSNEQPSETTTDTEVQVAEQDQRRQEDNDFLCQLDTFLNDLNTMGDE